MKPNLALGHRVIDIDGREEKGSAILHLIQPLHTSGSLLRNSNQSLQHFVVLLGILLHPIPTGQRSSPAHKGERHHHDQRQFGIRCCKLKFLLDKEPHHTVPTSWSHGRCRSYLESPDGAENVAASTTHMRDNAQGSGVNGEHDGRSLRNVTNIQWSRFCFQTSPQESQHKLELRVVGRAGIGQGAVLGIGNLGLDALVNQESSIAAIINNKIGSAIGAPVQGTLCTPPILLERLAFPGEHGSAIPCNGSSGVILCGEDVARAPSHLRSQRRQSLDQNSGLNSHMQRASDTRAFERLRCPKLLATRHEPGHLHFRQFQFQTPEIRLRHVLDLVFSPGDRLLHRKFHHGYCAREKKTKIPKQEPKNPQRRERIPNQSAKKHKRHKNPS